MKKSTIINILTGTALSNMGIVIVFFILNVVEMSHLKVNSDEWFDKYGLMIPYIGWGACSHIPIIIGSFVNTHRAKQQNVQSRSTQYSYTYNQKTRAYELSSKK